MTEENRTTMRVILCRPNETAEIKELRRELKVCDQVKERSGHVRENLEVIDRDREKEARGRE